MTRFNDLFASSGLPVIFDHHGETVTYRPLGGANRSITAVVKSMQTADLDEDGNELLTESVSVLVTRSSTLGIDKPAFGDEIIRAATIEDDTRPYLYAGEITTRSSSYWKLRFWRYKRTAQGIS